MECLRDHFHKDQILDGRFRTIAPLNHGSFGMVFLAEDLVTKQQVAIKCLTKPAAASGSTTSAPFDESAEELACHAILKFHPHLVNLVHHFETAAHSYLVLEYCSQGDLYEAIRLGRGPLQTDHVRRFMLQLISAVEHMHENGLYHRDIKPENIFLTKDGSVKLGDFGLATRSTWSYEASVGSDRYMAPEQYDPADVGYSPAKSDLWSVGICLLNVLFSRNPFATPTESDPIFADYRKDRQSLFDIFPNMSQDTFEVLCFAMTIDPTKRDLSQLREAILRVVSFTTDEEDVDDFCTEQRDVVRASANRGPLRTPSIQSPMMDTEAFPWAKALHSSPPQRSLSIIHDDIYDEDLFLASEKGLNLGESWHTGHFNTPSMGSVLDSAFSGSFKSMAIRRAVRNPPRPDPITIPSSLPAPAARPIPSMSQVFGKKDTVAKSWSDMWEEDEEEFEREVAALQERPTNNSRSWSHESTRKPTPVPSVLREKRSCSALNVRPSRPEMVTPVKPGSSPNENDPFGWRTKNQKRSPRQIPADKWAALGDRRRNPQAKTETASSVITKKRSLTTSSRRRSGSTAQDSTTYHRRDSRSKAHPAHFDKDWRQHKSVDSSPDTDAEWVGGWHNFHL
jgi:serine/threonine protein kinase